MLHLGGFNPRSAAPGIPVEHLDGICRRSAPPVNWYLVDAEIWRRRLGGRGRSWLFAFLGRPATFAAGLFVRGAV
jgi:hypothetical protein